MTKRRMWTEEEIDARCEAKMQSVLTQVNTKLDFLGDRMVDMLGNVGDPTVPLEAQRPGILRQIRDENAEHAAQGIATDQKLTSFIETTGKELLSLKRGQASLERGHHRAIKLLGKIARWLWRMNDDEKVPWIRTISVGTVLSAGVYNLFRWSWPYLQGFVVKLYYVWIGSGR